MKRARNVQVVTMVGLCALGVIGFVAGSAPAQAEDEDELTYSYSKMLIEHNATDEDTGFQIAVDGEAWNRLDVWGPNDRPVMAVRARGRMRRVGFTEMFFETQEPENAEVPIPRMLKNLPEGTYEFEGITVDGEEIEGEAYLSHAIPAGPELVFPSEGDVVSANSDLTIVWNPVTETIYGETVNVTHYQLIVEEDVPFEHAGFGRTLLSIHVPSSKTSMRVPAEFLEPGTAYKYEVLALEESGNQTLSSSEFETE
jgi:hypothetical protein